MDRKTVYPFEIPYETDFLSAERFAYEGLGLLALDILGASALASGLACGPTSPHTLSIIVGPGRLYQLENLENSTWGNVGLIGGLPADTNVNHQILKQGLLRDPLTIALTAPAGAGNSVNYLIQAAVVVTDTTPIVLPFVDPNPPYEAWSGPDNTGGTLNTIRADVCSVNAKSGTAAATGTQTTPAPDSGFVGLYVVTVANGQTQIDSSGISVLGGAPFLTETLTQKISLATGDARYLRQVNARIQLSGNLNVYVSPSGNDSHSGMSTGQAWATVQHAGDTILSGYDLNGFSVTVNVADGTGQPGFSANGRFLGATGPGSFTILSTSGSNTACTFTGSGNTFSASDGAEFTLQNLGVASTGGNAVNAGWGGRINHSGLNFGTTSNNHNGAQNTGRVDISTADDISGDCVAHVSEAGGGIITFSGTVAVTLHGTRNFSGAFAVGHNNGSISCPSGSVTFGGTASSATGQRYNMTNGAAMDTNGGGANYLPGNSPGSSTTAYYS